MNMGLFNSFKKEKAKKSAAKNENHTDIAAACEAMLEEVSIDITSVEATKLPIEQLGLFGAGIASVLPPLRTISQNITFNNGNLFRWVNSANAAGTLKLNTKDNLLGGAFIDKQGISRYAKFQAAGAQSATAVTVMPIDPAKLMMAAALMAIEHKLDDIAETQKKILTFLEHDKEAEIESDLKILADIARELKFNWDNTEYTTNHYKLALDIKRSAEKNIIFCRKQIEQAVKESKAIHRPRKCLPCLCRSKTVISDGSMPQISKLYDFPAKSRRGMFFQDYDFRARRKIPRAGNRAQNVTERRGNGR